MNSLIASMIGIAPAGSPNGYSRSGLAWNPTTVTKSAVLPFPASVLLTRLLSRAFPALIRMLSGSLSSIERDSSMTIPILRPPSLTPTRPRRVPGIHKRAFWRVIFSVIDVVANDSTIPTIRGKLEFSWTLKKLFSK